MSVCVCGARLWRPGRVRFPCVGLVIQELDYIMHTHHTVHVLFLVLYKTTPSHTLVSGHSSACKFDFNFIRTIIIIIMGA